MRRQTSQGGPLTKGSSLVVVSVSVDVLRRGEGKETTSDKNVTEQMGYTKPFVSVYVYVVITTVLSVEEREYPKRKLPTTRTSRSPTET